MSAEDDTETWKDDLRECPDCGAAVCYPGILGQDALNEGYNMLVCEDRCGFRAREQWTLHQTVRVE